METSVECSGSMCRCARHLLAVAIFATLAIQVLNQETPGIDVRSRKINEVSDKYSEKSSLRRQPLFRNDVPFPCDTRPGAPGSRSVPPPTSVHRLRPGDIDVIGAMGDSITAANGALQEYAVGSIVEHRGVSWCAGGRGTWREYLTLPNILKEFNPRLAGYSRGGGELLGFNSQMNVAAAMSGSQDALQQARTLVDRMRSDPRVDFHNHWKMVTVMFGANNLCSEQCYNKFANTPAYHQKDLRVALDYLHKNLPRTFVNLVPVIDVTISVRIKRSPTCRLLHRFFCTCYHQNGQGLEVMSQLAREYQAALLDLVSSGRYDTKEDFTVVLQPFIQFLNNPAERHVQPIHISYITHDCFHFSQKGHALAANLLWNNLLEPVWNKSLGYPGPILKTFHCPSANSPYLFTRKNSYNFQATG